MPEYRFRLDITREQYLLHYQGRVRQVQVEDDHGRRIRFPASALRAHVAQDGVRGEFLLVTDETHRLVALRRLDAPG